MPSDNVMRAAKRVARCKPVDWDCSRSPGHPGLDALLEAVDALRSALDAPVSPPAAAKRERRAVWFMENNAGLWMRADFCANTQDPNEARWFSTRADCETACEADRRNGPHPGAPALYRPTEHIFFGDDDVAVSPAPRGEAVAHRPGHRPPVGWRAVVEIVSASDLEADDVIFAEGRWLCVLDDDLNDSTQVMAAEIIDDAGGRGVSDTTYGEWFARVVALVPQRQQGGAR